MILSFFYDAILVERHGSYSALYINMDLILESKELSKLSRLRTTILLVTHDVKVAAKTERVLYMMKWSKTLPQTRVPIIGRT